MHVIAVRIDERKASEPPMPPCKALAALRGVAAAVGSHVRVDELVEGDLGFTKSERRRGRARGPVSEAVVALESRPN
jgi:hypothetical protein